jgi:hypothetical protein
MYDSYNTAHENKPQWVRTNAEKSPNSRLLQRGRAVGRGILPMIGIFIRVHYRAGNHGIHRLVAQASGMKIVSGFIWFFADSSAQHPLFTTPMVVLWIA